MDIGGVGDSLETRRQGDKETRGTGGGHRECGGGGVRNVSVDKGDKKIILTDYRLPITDYRLPID
ncbi:hypothetical protein PI95_027565 [Hassallia byssoidea VB512170]|uniref:Uncharacterized protein n=1 Tax=Hassallia byssoidea VB512170 TaxID=1304833 RepID=A0A846HFR7_9CYAN|nr:hypothetical protein [Hassalia byssoidea]NEU76182.1 hypothetical protein [Hassalia byssoidea VB512170]